MRRLVAALFIFALFGTNARAQTAVLAGGSLARFERPASIAFTDGADEWEAFLSLDGGRYYAVRITPHLDADVTSVTWRVPNVMSRDARILIRVGDEQCERAIELPQSFAIEPDALQSDRDYAQATLSDAEAARPGDAAVSEWAEGNRRGTVATARHHDEQRVDDVAVDAAHVDDAALSSPAIAPAERHRVIAIERTTHRSHCAGSYTPTRDLLQQTSRLNI